MRQGIDEQSSLFFSLFFPSCYFDAAFRAICSIIPSTVSAIFWDYYIFPLVPPTTLLNAKNLNFSHNHGSG
jgi:hypothetical protein